MGNTEGKEVRFGATSSALFGVSSTMTSTGSADSAYDSFTPMGGFALLTGMMLGEVSPGGVGSGLYTILLMAIIAVFIGGLMIGRTPEYLGKKIQKREVQLAGIGILVMPVTVLVITGIAVSVHAGRSHPSTRGRTASPRSSTPSPPRATTTARPSAGCPATPTSTTSWAAWPCCLAASAWRSPRSPCRLAGGQAGRPRSLGTFRTDNGMFVGLLLGVILIVGGLTFFPAVALGPVVEQLSHGRFW